MTPATTSDEFADRFPRAYAVFAAGVAKGLHLGAQVYLSVEGRVLADAGLGQAQPGEPMTAAQRTHWLSAGKPLTAVLIAQLVEEGRLAWHDPVARYIPEFAQHGKEQITLKHVLTHTAGLRNVETGWPDVPWEETLARICAAPLDSGATPGQTAGYHVASTWFLLGELIQRLTGRTYEEVLRERLCVPCGMPRTLAAIPERERAQLAIAPLFERREGRLMLLDWHLPPRSDRVSPGSSLRGPIRELGRFYEVLLQQGRGPHGRVLRPETVAELLTRHRSGQYDATFGHIVDFGLGFLLDSNRYGAQTVPYGYGRHCSPRTFGHGGSQSSQGFGDPDRQLAVAWLFNGRCGEGQHQRRNKAFNEALYEDVGLARTS
uniref:Class A beta-lactamase-related serine hydrolase n=1 Tax=Schlesneria paludicola TaxID=360056 RepID=A0A7C4QMX6_9PLAN